MTEEMKADGGYINTSIDKESICTVEYNGKPEKLLTMVAFLIDDLASDMDVAPETVAVAALSRIDDIAGYKREVQDK